MNIFDHFQHINLTADQRKALEKLQDFLEGEERVFILQGYAGTGKTTLLKGFCDHLQSVTRSFQLMAPTGRAAKVINQKTGFQATTIHKGIYSFKDLIEIEGGENNDEVSYLYQYKLWNNDNVHNSILIVDEASMVSDILSEGEFFRFGSGFLLHDLVEYSRIQDSSVTSKIIFIGDPAQLPPIGMNTSPALSPAYLEEKFGLKTMMAELKEVKRQEADNGILHSAIKIRQCLTSGFFNDFDLRANGRDIFNPLFQNFLETYNAQTDQRIIICYKNTTALELNKTIRRDRYGNDLPIQPSDTIIIGTNNYQLGILNGEFAVVAEASPSVETREVRFYAKGGQVQTVRLTWRNVVLVIPDEDGQPKSITGNILENFLYGDNNLTSNERKALYIDFKNRHPGLKKGTEELKQAIRSDKYFNCIMLKYGYAVTCHKAQGGEWPSAFVFWDRGTAANFNFYESGHNTQHKTNADFYRWAYTAMTRASKKLYCINPPFFSSFTGMTYIDSAVQKAYNELTGQQPATINLNFNKEVEDELKRFGLEDSPLPLQNHYIQRWYNLRKQYIDIVGYERLGYEIRYFFKREKQTAAFKYWVNAKNEFRSASQKLPSHTNSDEFFETIAKILAVPVELNINRNTVAGIISKIEFDLETEETKPFLKNLFDQISSQLLSDEVITDITHLEYRDRYTIKKNGADCVFDFEYNKDGFFGRVLPLESQCKSHELIVRIREIVKKLMEADYVV
jgi:hypothetical protein